MAARKRKGGKLALRELEQELPDIPQSYFMVDGQQLKDIGQVEDFLESARSRANIAMDYEEEDAECMSRQALKKKIKQTKALLQELQLYLDKLNALCADL